MMQLLEALEMWSYAAWVRESLYGWAIMLTIHAYGNAIVVGAIFIVALRVFGLFRTVPITTLNRFLIPLIWTGVIMQVISGFSLFLTKPPRYATDLLFLSKLTFVVLGVVVTLYLQKALKQEAASWQAGNHVTTRGLRLAGLAAFAWAGVLVMGRLTAYLGQL